ncbi:MAG TPA: DinB family protein [Thermomicrobiales bacterium]|nr:DinB family protein [Thermomicrobiales bacterium]
MSDDPTTTATATPAIPVEEFRAALLTMLDEAFSGATAPSTFFTDKGTSLFETLDGIDAATASRRFSERASNIAAQVNHIRFYLDVLMEGLRSGWKPADWPGSWEVDAVSDAEWQELVDRLKASYAEVRTFAETNPAWNGDYVGGGIAIVAHTAYHLGEIRSSLAALQVPETPTQD